MNPRLWPSYCFGSSVFEDDIEESICDPEEGTISTPSTVNTLNNRSILALAGFASNRA